MSRHVRRVSQILGTGFRSEVKRSALRKSRGVHLLLRDSHVGFVKSCFVCAIKYFLLTDFIRWRWSWVLWICPRSLRVVVSVFHFFHYPNLAFDVFSDICQVWVPLMNISWTYWKKLFAIVSMSFFYNVLVFQEHDAFRESSSVDWFVSPPLRSDNVVNSSSVISLSFPLWIWLWNVCLWHCQTVVIMWVASSSRNVCPWHFTDATSLPLHLN